MPDWDPEANDLFLRAIEFPAPEDRWRLLDEACAGRPALRARVDGLIRAGEQAGSFLEHPALDSEPTSAHSPGTAGGAAAAPPVGGTVVGRYTLVQEIGEGGMGTVYLAQQTEPVRRLVAAKLVKPGMDSRQVLARFEAERQALALMDHPNIAKVLDAGATAEGRPYFVMELVRGVPITRYCDDHRLGLRDRLGLFADVCRAVQHAHQKGVIHRDLKPNNVLVAPYDGKPVVKVIDFGVAKATGQALADRTLFTGLGAVVGTPEYMSPEQAELNNLDIDTRSDVYALGVLLYELLTGTTPLTHLRVKQVALLEVLRVIREEETPRPSARLSSSDGLPGIAAVRGVEPAGLSRLVRGDLDWIVMKALEKDRNRRYETANGLALDVQRYLADEPVEACPPSAKYRLRKFARRNKTGLAIAGLLVFFIALLGGGGWVVRDRAALQAGVAHDLELALDRADLFQGEGKRAEALAALDRAEFLAGQARADAARDGRLAALRERLDAEARDREFIARFEDIWLRDATRVDLERSQFAANDVFPAVREAFGRWGIAIGAGAPARIAARIQGRPKSVRAGLVAALDQCLWRAPPGETQTRQWLVAVLAAADTDAWRVRVRRAFLRDGGNRLVPLARAADVRTQPPSFLLRIAETLPGGPKSDRLDLLRNTRCAYPADLWANHRLAEELLNDGQPSEAVRYFTAALALQPASPGLALNRGYALWLARELDEALADFRQSLALAPQYAVARNNIAGVLFDKGLHDEAIALHREAVRLDKNSAVAHCRLGNALTKMGQPEEGIAEYREAIRLRKGYAEAHSDLGFALQGQGRIEEAVAEYREAIRADKGLPEAHGNLARALSARGDPDGAIAEYREAIRLRSGYAEAHSGICRPLLKKGLFDDAIAECREAIRLKPDLPEAHNNLGRALLARNLVDDAIAAHREAVRLKPDNALFRYELGLVLGTNHPGEAIAEYREAIRIDEGYAEAYCNLGLLLRQEGQFREALVEVRRGHEIGSRRPGWRHPSLQWVRQSERLVILDGKLPGILDGTTSPAGPGERIELAGLCSLKRLNLTAARFYEEAFAEDARLADDLGAAHRYKAACAASLAGSTRGKDDDHLDDEGRARLRRQALGWLRADLDAWRRPPDKGPGEVRPNLVHKLRHWLADPDFTGVRGSEALARLPEAERLAWQELWSGVADTLARVQPGTTPEKTSGAK